MKVPLLAIARMQHTSYDGTSPPLDFCPCPHCRTQATPIDCRRSLLSLAPHQPRPLRHWHGVCSPSLPGLFGSWRSLLNLSLFGLPLRIQLCQPMVEQVTEPHLPPVLPAAQAYEGAVPTGRADRSRRLRHIPLPWLWPENRFAEITIQRHCSLALSLTTADEGDRLWWLWDVRPDPWLLLPKDCVANAAIKRHLGGSSFGPSAAHTHLYIYIRTQDKTHLYTQSMHNEI